MKNKNDKIFIAIYIGWTFLHLVFLYIGRNSSFREEFWPFAQTRPWYYEGIYTGMQEFTLENSYDFFEFIIYVGVPGISFIIYKLLSQAGVFKNNL